MFKPNTKILIVDDMKTMRMFCKKTLKKMGYENFEEADDGETAWPKLEEAISSGSPFELVLSDWNMPGMMGIDLLRKVRADQRMAKIPFVLVTAESDAEQVKEAITAGVSNYIVKPYTEEKLTQILTVVYQKHAA